MVGLGSGPLNRGHLDVQRIGLPLLAVSMAAAILASGSVRADGNPRKGAALFLTCNACHQVGVGARNAVGPILNDIVGRRAATRSGYAYSPGMQEAGAEGLRWTDKTLNGYIENPRAYLRGTRMAFAGLPDPQDRRDLISYLKTLKFDNAAETRDLR